ncbi:hypothetical protein Emag_005260 [Eimeria magna]
MTGGGPSASEAPLRFTLRLLAGALSILGFLPSLFIASCVGGGRRKRRAKSGGAVRSPYTSTYTSRKATMDDVAGLRGDLEELESLLSLCKRPAVRRVLTDACQQVRGRIEQVEQLTKPSAQTPASAEVFNTIDRFAWDQTPDFVKVYVHLDGLGALPADATSTTFEEKSAELILRSGEHWDSIAQPLHQKNAIPPPDLSSDPSESIMTMMKSLYNQGDSEMKRTIAKAWTESHEKKSKGVPVDDGLF